ncbi:reverse transcriptase [Trichonephila clavipes]|nr:reverse transcriptase [Trichonephila clavipes]
MIQQKSLTLAEWISVPSPFRIPGNERADQKGKQRTESSPPEVPLTFRRAESIISTYIDKYIAVTWSLWVLSRGTWREPRLLLAFTNPPNMTFWEYTSTGLTWLCGHARMDGELLLQCTGLDKYPTDDVVSRYWEARRQMVKKPRTGVA